MKFGFLFGAGAELSFGLPSGGRFALEIFRYDSTNSKNKFREMRNALDGTTTYASEWLPEHFQDKSISSFGKSVFVNIIKDTIEHRRGEIICRINDFDTIAIDEAQKMKERHGISIIDVIENALGRNLENIHMNQNISFVSEFQAGNQLFRSSYFSALLMLYKNPNFTGIKVELGKILLSILQLQVGALSEELTRRINDSPFEKKDDSIDLFDDIGDIMQLNYSASGLMGMDYLLDQSIPDKTQASGQILYFAQMIIESLYASVLDYKSLIDSNWHYLYDPKTDWSKFCKICIFLLTVREYIVSIAKDVNLSSSSSYYRLLKDAMDSGTIEVSCVATTNYNEFASKVLERNVAYLNGSTDIWYDPYLNRIGSQTELAQPEQHIIVPLMFTQSGTKPMTSIDMSMQYVDTYRQWKESDAIVVIGFGFNKDDEHINGIIRTLIDVDQKDLIILTVGNDSIEGEIQKVANKLKVSNRGRIKLIKVNTNGLLSDNSIWIDWLSNYRPL